MKYRRHRNYSFLFRNFVSPTIQLKDNKKNTNISKHSKDKPRRPKKYFQKISPEVVYAKHTKWNFFTFVLFKNFLPYLPLAVSCSTDFSQQLCSHNSSSLCFGCTLSILLRNKHNATAWLWLAMWPLFPTTNFSTWCLRLPTFWQLFTRTPFYCDFLSDSWLALLMIARVDEL